jgi:hypothetical protein
MTMANSSDRMQPDPAYGTDADMQGTNRMQTDPTLDRDGAMGVMNERDVGMSSGASRSSTATAIADAQPLFPESDAGNYRQQWQDIQAGFVDEPRESVQKADALVGQVVQQLTSRFSEERHKLEGQLDSGSELTTEDMRRALMGYRSFFQRLLST